MDTLMRGTLCSTIILSIQITGSVVDANGVSRYIVKGHWDQKFTVGKVKSGEGRNAITDDFQVLWEVPPW